MYTISIPKAPVVEQSVNHVFIVDVSGSMYDSLPKMRTHIKNKLGLLVRPSDTVSLIYFSARNEYGVIFEGQKVHNIKDLNALHHSIDKYLNTLSLTGFLGPIEESIKLAQRLEKNKETKDNVNSFIFMTDGYDNQHQEKDIIQACSKLSEHYQNISFLEYGWYCNRPLIAKMAEVSGANHVFSKDYLEYEPMIEKIFQMKTNKKKEISLKSLFSTDSDYQACKQRVKAEQDIDYVYYMDQSEIIQANILLKDNDLIVLTPEHISDVFYVSLEDHFQSCMSQLNETHQYITFYAFVKKMKSKLAWNVLKVLGDVKLIKMYNNCFSKQEYSNLIQLIKDMVAQNSLRFQDGKNTSMIPDENAYTVLSLLNDLVSGENFLHTHHEAFDYNRIGAKTVQAETQQFFDDHTAKIFESLKEKLAQEKNPVKIQEISEEIKNLPVQNQWVPKFKETVSEQGEPIRNIIFNESRPNVSVSITKQGFVEIPDDKAKEFGLPKEIPTQIFRNYTIIKDGIINMEKLPVSLDEKTFVQLQKNGLLTEQIYAKETVYVLNLTDLPVINRAMIKSVKANDFFKAHLDLNALKAKQKVFKFYMEELEPKKQEKLSSLYGERAALWLDEIGIKDYGFSPSVKKEKSGDFYYSKELNIKIAGLSTLPSVKAVLEKRAKKSKLNLADTLMLDAIAEYEAFKDSDIFIKSLMSEEKKKEFIIAWLKSETEATIATVRKLQNELNKILYSIILGQVWFDEFSSIEEGTMTMPYRGIDVVVQAILSEKEIAI